MRRPFRPQINRHGRPPNKDGADADVAEHAHGAEHHNGDWRRYLCLRERGEYRRTGAGLCFPGRFCAKILNLHALHSRRSFGLLRRESGAFHAHITQVEFPRATLVA